MRHISPNFAIVTIFDYFYVFKLKLFGYSVFDMDNFIGKVVPHAENDQIISKSMQYD